jgi:hypothetical protein
MTATGKMAKIAESLFARATDLETTGPSLPLSVPEDPDFSRPADLKYLEAQVFYNVQQWRGLSAGKMDMGLFQVSVIWPKNKGMIAPSNAVDQVMAHFPKGLRLFNGSTVVTISDEPYQGFTLDDDDTVKLPVVIPWSA